MASSVSARPLGDTALLIELGDSIDAATHARVRSALQLLDEAAVPGVLELVPAYTGIAVHYDPLQFVGTGGRPFDGVARAVLDLVGDAEAGQAPAGRDVEIAVAYGGAAGPDLDVVAAHTGVTPEQVIALHTGAEYIVYMIGFAPGFPYLAGLPPQLATPRRASPRARVPAGSVGIAGTQTGIYPLETPGGWQLIGRTRERLFRPYEQPPTLLEMGDRVRFRAV